MQSLVKRPYVDWSQFKIKTVEPEIYLSREQEEDTCFEIFRRLSHKVAGCRCDLPWGSQVIVAYCKVPDSAEPPQAIGIIAFSIAAEATLKHSSHLERNFMSEFFHMISFLFVDQRFQRKGVGSHLLSEAMRTIRGSEIKRSVHLEAAKGAVKFFKKMGFTLSGKSGKSARRGSRLFKECFYMQHQLGS